MVELWPALAADEDAAVAGEGETTFEPPCLARLGELIENYGMPEGVDNR